MSYISVFLSYFELTVGTWTLSGAHPAVAYWSTLQSPWAVSVQPALVPSLGLLVEAWVSAPGLYTWAHLSLVLGSAARQQGPSVLYGSAFHRWVAALSPEPSKLPIYPSWYPSQWRGLPGWQNFSSFTVPTQGHRSCLNSFFFFFLFHPTWLPKWSFLPFWLHEILCQHSVGILQELLHTYMYFWCICGRRWALCPVPPSWSPPASILYKDLMVTWEYRRRKIYQDVHFKCMLYISLSVTVLISLP